MPLTGTYNNSDLVKLTHYVSITQQ